jgi:hypothetical protein
LLGTTGRAYGVGSGRERLRLAEQINNHPYNRRFWVTGVRPFEGGQITFRPIFTQAFVDQARATGKAPSGSHFAVIWIPPLTPPVKLKIGNCTESNLPTYWAARNSLPAARTTHGKPARSSLPPNRPRASYSSAAASGLMAGPLTTCPSVWKREPWQGQSQVRSFEFHCTTQPRCVQTAERSCSWPSSSR